jgi:hypothetical protein
MELPEHIKRHLYKICYITNNNFAYKYDAGENPDRELKSFNFVPTYDHICLACLKRNAKETCSKCKSVFFCDKECKKKCQKIHKKHCERDLFCLCIMCGNPDVKYKCEFCPAKFCSDMCKDKIYAPHREIDCNYFHKTFGTEYIVKKTKKTDEKSDEKSDEKTNEKPDEKTNEKSDEKTNEKSDEKKTKSKKTNKK